MLEAHKSKKSSNYRSLKKINRFISVINKKEGASCITTHLLFIADSVPCRSGSRRFQVRCGMTTAVERQLAAVIVTVGMSVLPAVCQILRSGKAGWCEKNIWYNLSSLNERPHGSGRAVEAELKKKLLNYKATILWQRLLVLI